MEPTRCSCGRALVALAAAATAFALAARAAAGQDQPALAGKAAQSSQAEPAVSATDSAASGAAVTSAHDHIRKIESSASAPTGGPPRPGPDRRPAPFPFSTNAPPTNLIMRSEFRPLSGSSLQEAMRNGANVDSLAAAVALAPTSAPAPGPGIATSAAMAAAVTGQPGLAGSLPGLFPGPTGAPPRLLPGPAGMVGLSPASLGTGAPPAMAPFMAAMASNLAGGAGSRLPSVPPGLNVPGVQQGAVSAAAPASASAAGSEMESRIWGKTNMEERVRLKYDDTDLDAVLKEYSEWTGRAIMKSPDVPAVKVTLKCPVFIPLREALLAIEGVLSMYGVGLVPIGDKFIKVVSIANARQAGIPTGVGPPAKDTRESDHLESRVIELKYMDLTEAQGVIQNLLHPFGKIIPLERASCLLITDTSVNIHRIIEILGYIDQPIGAREELRIFRIRHAKPSEIQTKLDAIIADTQSRDAQINRMRQQLMQRQVPAAAPAPARPGMPPMPAPPVAQSASDAADLGEERGLVQGKVKMVSDDRTSSLIIITRPEQFAFFEDIIEALDQKVEPDVTIRVFHLEYANAEEIMSVLTSLISSSASTKSPTPLPQPNTPTPTPTPAQPAAPGQGGQAGAVTTTTGTADVQISGRLSADVKVLADKRTNALLVMASKADMEIIEDVIGKIDIMLAQVLLEVVIIEVGLKNDSQTGVDWLQRSMIAYNEKTGGGRSPFLGFAGVSREATKGALRDATAVRRVSDDISAPGSGLTYYFTIFDLNVDAVLNMLASTSEARILSTPIILTTDNKEARILVGEKRPIVTSTSVTTGGNQQSSYEYTSIGIELKVTPRINRKGFVVMDINQKIDNVGGKVTIDNNEVPIIITREFGASLAVNDRRTIVVGGLVSDERQDTQVRIPFLGRIPLLGLLFRSDSDEKQRRELLVLMTPYVLTTPGEVHDETAQRHGSIRDKEVLKLWDDSWSRSEMGKHPAAGEEDRAVRPPDEEERPVEETIEEPSPRKEPARRRFKPGTARAKPAEAGAAQRR